MAKSAKELCYEHLFSDRKDLEVLGVSTDLVNKVIRVREMYTLWVNEPNLKRRDLVQLLTKNHAVSLNTAYDDISIVESLIGQINKASKDYHRWRVLNMLMEAYEMAKNRKDVAGMIAASDKIGKYTQLDKEDPITEANLKPIQPFIPTSDVTVIGIKPIKNLSDLKQKLYKQYGGEEFEEVDFEEIDFLESLNSSIDGEE